MDATENAVMGGKDGCSEFLRQIGQNGNSRLLMPRFS